MRTPLLIPAAVLAAGVVHLASPGVAPASDSPRNATLPAVPCATEDSPGPCFWDAGSRGNGQGLSFWVDASQVLRYFDPSVGS